MDTWKKHAERSKRSTMKRQHQFLWVTLVMIFIALGAGIIANLMLTGNLIAIRWLVFFMVLDAVLAAVHLKWKPFKVVSHGMVLMVIVIFVIYMNVSQSQVFTLYFFPVIPLIALFLTGKRKGSLYALMTLFIAMTCLFVNRDTWHISGFDYGSLTNFLIANIALFLLLLFYEDSVSENQRHLHDVNEKLRLVSITDRLTQLYNREWLEERLQALIKDKRPFSVMLGDLDGFKRINDQYGHSEGDRVLKQVSRILREHAGQDSHVGRYGGDEFLIIVTDVDDGDALSKKAENLRRKVKEAQIDPKGKLSISFGVAVHQEHDTVDSLFSRADRAMYAAKDDGDTTRE